MLVFLPFACLLCLSVAQNNPETSKILREQRFNVGDGRTGSAFATENGYAFKEESSADGERLGEYSYVGADGETYNVKYSAGRDGFRILSGSGSHIPSTGREAAAYVVPQPSQNRPQLQAVPAVTYASPILPRRRQPTPQLQHYQPQQQQQQFAQPQQQRQQYVRPQQQQQQKYVQPQQQQRPQYIQPQQQQQQKYVQPQQQQRPQYIQPQQQQQQKYVQPQQQQVASQKFNPFINPHDPTHRNFAYNQHAMRFNGGHNDDFVAGVPNCADCAGFNPFVNPFDSSHNSANGFIDNQSSAVGRPIIPDQSSARQIKYKSPQISSVRANSEENIVPSFNFPPGQLKLNRFDSGFNFDFKST